jgi:hypothetical protein
MAECDKGYKCIVYGKAVEYIAEDNLYRQRLWIGI